jgi:hypothetical protein
MDRQNFTFHLHDTLNVVVHLLELEFGFQVFLGLCLVLETARAPVVFVLFLSASKRTLR